MKIQDVKKIAVIGSGAMGHGIAQVCAAGGYNVTMTDIKQEFLDKGKQAVMRTPCNHYFHVYCLVTLMNYKQNCPLCRTALPNLED